VVWATEHRWVPLAALIAALAAAVALSTVDRPIRAGDAARRGRHRVRPSRIAPAALRAGPAALTVIALVAGIGVATITRSGAAFAATTASTSNSWGAATISPPTGLAAGITCGNGGVPSADLTWTPSVTGAVTGYQLTRDAGAPVGITPRTASSYIDGGLPNNASHTWNLAALAAGWSSAPATVSATANCPPVAQAWGSNQYQQLGDGTTTDRDVPANVSLPAGVTITAVAGGSNFSLALTSSGKVYAWGYNAEGEFGNGITSVPGGPVLVNIPGGVTVTAIAAGGSHGLALTSTGAVYAWGMNTSGQLGDNTTTNQTSPVQVKGVGGTGTLANIKAIAAGGSHSLALSNTGTVYAWGSNTYGQLGDNTTTNRLVPVQVKGVGGSGTLTSITAISAGTSHSLAANGSGAAYAWGLNSSSQLGDTTTTQQNAPVRVRAVSGTGNLTGIKSVAAGETHSLAVTTTGLMYAWGYNSKGELGDGTTTSTVRPVKVSLPVGVTVSAADAGTELSVALTSSGQALAWGWNNSGQLGDSSTTNRTAPVTVSLPAGTTATAVAAGRAHSLSVTVAS
jgi:alpha-tubulin suppressor-like RCC1 family protein